jgi:hypothetical protein
MAKLTYRVSCLGSLTLVSEGPPHNLAAGDGALPAPNKQERGFQGADPRRANFLCDVWDELN